VKDTRLGSGGSTEMAILRYNALCCLSWLKQASLIPFPRITLGCADTWIGARI